MQQRFLPDSNWEDCDYMVSALNPEATRAPKQWHLWFILYAESQREVKRTYSMEDR